MKNPQNWIPSKFLKKSDGSYYPNPKYVLPGSLYLCDVYISKYVKIIKKYARGSFLDCGCGDAPFYDVYKNTVNEICCMDWSNSEHENKHLDVIADLNVKLILSDNTFDSVLLTDVLEHIYRPKLLICELHRILKKDGYLMIMVPFYYKLHEKPFDYYRYTEFALRKMCEETGFKIIELEAYGGYWNVIGDMVSKLLVRRSFLYKPFKILAKTVKLIPPFSRMNEKSKDSFPLGYCVVVKKV